MQPDIRDILQEFQKISYIYKELLEPITPAIQVITTICKIIINYPLYKSFTLFKDEQVTDLFELAAMEIYNFSHSANNQQLSGIETINKFSYLIIT